MTYKIQFNDLHDARQIVALVRQMSRQRGRNHPELGTVEVPLSLLNQASTLSTLYEGGTLVVHQDLCPSCPLKCTTSVVQEHNV